MSIVDASKFLVRQRRELAELLGFETRNKYEILDQDGSPLAYAAEQQKGLLGALGRQFLGHWRRFEVHFFGLDRELLFVARHPFRWLFQRFELFDAADRLLGALQQRFALLRRRFDISDRDGRVVLSVDAPIWRPWTFPILRDGREVAILKKRWTGLLAEAFTDKDSFAVELLDSSLTEDERRLVLAAAVFVDLQYFERKAQ